MLFVVFHVGAARYAIAGRHVAEVLPAIVWTPVAGAAQGVIGVFNYHGAPVPLIDARTLLGGNSEPHPEPIVHVDTRLRLQSRILVVQPDRAVEDNAQPALVGVLVDRVENTSRHEMHDFVDAGTLAQGAPYVGPVLTDALGVIQRIEPAHLLPASVRDEVLRQWGAHA